jgi:hypothetical protein
MMVISTTPDPDLVDGAAAAIAADLVDVVAAAIAAVAASWAPTWGWCSRSAVAAAVAASWAPTWSTRSTPTGGGGRWRSDVAAARRYRGGSMRRRTSPKQPHGRGQPPELVLTGRRQRWRPEVDAGGGGGSRFRKLGSDAVEAALFEAAGSFRLIFDSEIPARELAREELRRVGEISSQVDALRLEREDDRAASGGWGIPLASRASALDVGRERPVAREFLVARIDSEIGVGHRPLLQTNV